MAIRITRNEEGNCITFVGSTNPAYWNACLSAEINANDPTRVDIINDIRTQNNASTQYEFYAVSYTDFADRDNNAFSDAQAMVDYINENANVTGLSEVGKDLTGVNVNFRLDDTNTSIIMDNGSSFGVNTIKAIADADGTIHIHAIGAEAPNTDGDHHERRYFEKLDHTVVSINGVSASGGLSDVVNALNELFTAGPFESVAISDPYSTMIADVAGIVAGYTLEGSSAVDPAGNDIFSNTGTGNYAGLKSTATINQAGEYFTFDIRGEGQIGFGLIHTDLSYSNGYFSGNSNYADPATFAISNSAHYGYQFSHWFHPTPNGSWTNYGSQTSVVYGPGWYNWDRQADWLAGNPVKIRCGIDTNGFISIESLQDDGSWVVHARSGYPVKDGAEFNLGVKSASAAARVYSEPMVHLLAVDSTPTTIGDDSIDVFGSGISGSLAGGIVSAGVDGNNDGFITTEAISAAGEYFEWTWSTGDANVGLFSENDHDVSDPQGDSSVWSNSDYIFYGARQENNGVISGYYSEAALNNTTLSGQAGSYYGRVGFDLNGRPFVATSTDGVNWVTYHRGNSAAPTGDYKFIWVSQNDNCDVATFAKGQLSAAPTMNFRYIESPDGAWSYPLFATSEEADYYELIESGSDNGSHTHVYPDDPTNTTWHMPNTSHSMEHGATPVGTGMAFEGNPINWTEITSLTNADLAPTAFNGLDYTFDEDSPVSIQVSPQDASWTTTVGGLPVGLSFSDGYSIHGTTPHVYGDQNHTVTVTRTNSYGSTQGSFNLKVVDDVTQNAISGMTVYGSNPITQSPDTVHHYSGSVNLDINLSLDAGTEIIWTQQNDSPVGGVGEYLQIGIADIGVDKAATELGDNIQDWQVKATIWTSSLNHQWVTGWTDNTDESYAESNDNIEWKIAFPADNGPVELYRAGVLVRTSSDNFTGSQVLTIGVPSAYNTTTRMPSFTKANIAFAGDPPEGFTQEGGTMDSATTLSTDSVVSLDQTLPVGKRILVNKSWIEANVLPYCQDSTEKAYFGVPKTTAAWGGIDLHTDFDAVMRWEGLSTDSHKTSIADGSDAVNRDESNIGSATNAYYHYAIEWDGTNLVALRDTDISKFSNESDYTQFNSYSAYENYSARSGSLPLVMATKSGGTMTLSMSGISVIDIPAAPAGILTPWTKALDFSGSSEHAKQVASYYTVNPLRMNDYATNIAAPTTSGYTANGSSVRPWATAVVFQSKNVTSNQHIWNQGEGAGTGDDNIYLRVSASGDLYFGWGREGSSKNECLIGNIGGISNASHYWGIYIANNGTRLSATNATAANLADAFDIRLMGSNDGPSAWSGLYDVGTAADWTAGSTGARMDRSYTGDFTIGGRSSNRNFHGKVASMVVTTLRINQPMPTDAEIELMITDPKKWLDDYKVGKLFRPTYTAGDFQNFIIGATECYRATQVWLMGDGTYDSYANGIRNQAGPEDQNNTKLQLNSMVSNDIQNVTIPGLT